MARAHIEDLAVGELDLAGQQVREIYAKNAPFYGVYRTAKRVCVQFADDADLEQKQRVLLVPLGTLRSDINGLINGWRSSDRHRSKARRRRFDRGTADGLISALQNEATTAFYQLTAVRAEVLQGRTAIGRFQYLGVAFAMVVLLYVLLWLTSFPAISSSSVSTIQTGDVLTAIAGGALGGFFSIAIGLRTRTVLPDLQWVANLSDAVLRMTVGVVAAAIFLCLLRGGFGMTFASPQQQTAGDGYQYWMRVFALGFIGGFFERLVPDLLGKAAGAVTTSDASGTPATGRDAATSSSPASSPPPGPDDTGDCLCNQPLDPAAATPDAALPVATGGVAAPPATAGASIDPSGQHI